MAEQYVDQVGNPLTEGDHVVIRATGQVGRVAAIDRYREVPIQVQVGWTRRGNVSVAKLRWCAPDRLILCPGAPVDDGSSARALADAVAYQQALEASAVNARRRHRELAQLADQLLGS